MSDITAAPTLRDLTGHGNDLLPVAGAFGDPLLLTYTGSRWLFVPGWDNHYLSAPSDPGLSVTEIDVRVDGDLTEYLPISTQDYNIIVAQPSTTAGGGSDGRFAVGQHKVNGTGRVWWTNNGVTWHHLDTSLAPSFGTGPGRLAWTFEANDGAASKRFRLYEQPSTAPRSWIDAPVTDTSRWTLVDTTTQAGTTSIANGTSPISISAFDGTVDTLGDQGWGALHRVQVRDAINGTCLYDLDPTGIVLPLTWTATTVAGQDANQATFTDRAGADWTITNFATTSYAVVVVDRDAVLFGNESHGTAGPDDPIFDIATSDPITVMMAVRWCYIDGTGSPLPLSHAEYDIAFTKAGYSMISTDAFGSGHVLGLTADGTDVVSGQGGLPEPGVVSVFAMTVDRNANTVTAWLDGTAGTPVSMATIGSMSWPNKALYVCAQVDGGGVVQRQAALELFASAVFDRVLTATEIALVTDEWSAGGRQVIGDDYAPIVFGS